MKSQALAITTLASAFFAAARVSAQQNLDSRILQNCDPLPLADHPSSRACNANSAELGSGTVLIDSVFQNIESGEDAKTDNTNSFPIRELALLSRAELNNTDFRRSTQESGPIECRCIINTDTKIPDGEEAEALLSEALQECDVNSATRLFYFTPGRYPAGLRDCLVPNRFAGLRLELCVFDPVGGECSGNSGPIVQPTGFPTLRPTPAPTAEPTEAPVTAQPTTSAPSVSQPVTPSPTTPSPTTPSPTTPSPTTPSPTTLLPSTLPPSTQQPVIPEPVTPQPTESSDDTAAPISSQTQAPTLVPTPDERPVQNTTQPTLAPASLPTIQPLPTDEPLVDEDPGDDFLSTPLGRTAVLVPLSVFCALLLGAYCANNFCRDERQDDVRPKPTQGNRGLV